MASTPEPVYIGKMQFAQLFEVGARWRHREQDFVVVISRVIEAGHYALAFVDGLSRDYVGISTEGVSDLRLERSFQPVDEMTRFILYGDWTSEDLLLHFEPLLLRPTRYEQIADGGLFPEVT